MRYYARSASDKTKDWPYWFVADSEKGGLNVTEKYIWPFALTWEEDAKELARVANNVS